MLIHSWPKALQNIARCRCRRVSERLSQSALISFTCWRWARRLEATVERNSLRSVLLAGCRRAWKNTSSTWTSTWPAWASTGRWWPGTRPACSGPCPNRWAAPKAYTTGLLGPEKGVGGWRGEVWEKSEISKLAGSEMSVLVLMKAQSFSALFLALTNYKYPAQFARDTFSKS